MADTGIFATTVEVARKAGTGVNATSIAEAYCNDFLAQAESFINATCRYNFSDNYTALNADLKMILKEVATNMAAIYAIQWDITSFGSRIAAEDQINILRDGYLRGLSILRDKKLVKFINEG